MWDEVVELAHYDFRISEAFEEFLLLGYPVNFTLTPGVMVYRPSEVRQCV